MSVSFFQNFTATPQTVELADLLNEIRGNRYAEKIRRCRELFAAWKVVCPKLDNQESPEAQAYNALKKTLPAFTMSGTAQDRKTPLEHSGLLQVDLDKLNGTLEAVRAKVLNDPHVAFGFASPSGDGLKLGLRIDGTRHAESFLAAEKYFRDEYSVKIDPSVKDLLHLCFVSHDPDLWENDGAVELPIPAAPAPQHATKTAGKPLGIVLPSGGVSITESARAIFESLGPDHKLFWRGGALVEPVETEGVIGLEILRPEKFCSDVEKIAPVFAWRSAGKGDPCLKPAQMNVDIAKRVLAASEAREFLPNIASVLRCPVLAELESGDVKILGRGYHSELGGLLIVAGERPPQVELSEAVASLLWLVEQYDFQAEGDRSRALAAFITPALRIGGHLRGNIPFDAAEADQSQSGKGHRLEKVCSLYNEKSYFVTSKAGGVGSVDESFAAALVAGRPFVCLDNFRGKMNSQNLEAFLTAPGMFPARIPHKGEVLVDPKKFMLQMSSNGLETTADLANRASICRIRKRHGFTYRDTLGELKDRQPYFLGCVFSVVAEWLANGKPRTTDNRHDFREWCQTLDWIVQNILGCAPLMDGHQAAQERTSNPALTFMRAVALAVAGDGRLGVALIASELVELCDMHAIEIPGKPADEDRAKRQIGSLCKLVFRDGDTVSVDGYTISRVSREYRKPSGDLATSNAYTFTK